MNLGSYVAARLQRQQESAPKKGPFVAPPMDLRESKDANDAASAASASPVPPTALAAGIIPSMSLRSFQSASGITDDEMEGDEKAQAQYRSLVGLPAEPRFGSGAVGGWTGVGAPAGVRAGAAPKLHIVKEGWVWRRGRLGAFKQCYAVARQGDKTGMVFLFKSNQSTYPFKSISLNECANVRLKDAGGLLTTLTGGATHRVEFKLSWRKTDVVLACDQLADARAWVDTLQTLVPRVAEPAFQKVHQELATVYNKCTSLNAQRRELEQENDALKHDLDRAQTHERAQVDLLHQRDTEYRQNEAALATEVRTLSAQLRQALAENEKLQTALSNEVRASLVASNNHTLFHEIREAVAQLQSRSDAAPEALEIALARRIGALVHDEVTVAVQGTADAKAETVAAVRATSQTLGTSVSREISAAAATLVEHVTQQTGAVAQSVDAAASRLGAHAEALATQVAGQQQALWAEDLAEHRDTLIAAVGVVKSDVGAVRTEVSGIVDSVVSGVTPAVVSAVTPAVVSAVTPAVVSAVAPAVVSAVAPVSKAADQNARDVQEAVAREGTETRAATAAAVAELRDAITQSLNDFAEAQRDAPAAHPIIEAVATVAQKAADASPAATDPVSYATRFVTHVQDSLTSLQIRLSRMDVDQQREADLSRQAIQQVYDLGQHLRRAVTELAAGDSAATVVPRSPSPVSTAALKRIEQSIDATRQEQSLQNAAVAGEVAQLAATVAKLVGAARPQTSESTLVPMDDDRATAVSAALEAGIERTRDQLAEMYREKQQVAVELEHMRYQLELMHLAQSALADGAAAPETDPASPCFYSASSSKTDVLESDSGAVTPTPDSIKALHFTPTRPSSAAVSPLKVSRARGAV